MVLENKFSTATVKSASLSVTNPFRVCLIPRYHLTLCVEPLECISLRIITTRITSSSFHSIPLLSSVESLLRHLRNNNVCSEEIFLFNGEN